MILSSTLGETVAKKEKKDVSLSLRLEEFERRMFLLKIQYEKYFSGLEKIEPLKEREEIISSIKFEKNDPFLFDSQSSNELSDIKLKGFITISNKNYAVVDYLDNEGSITTESIGGKNTNLLPRGASIKEINPGKGYISISYLNEIFVISFEG